MAAKSFFTSAFLLICFWTPMAAQDAGSGWHDPSPHTVQFVSVDKDVKLEVLDWGGTGRPIVLLAGLGDTAHVYDDFAPKLTADYHVYGITRRGYGASSAPQPSASNYSADRLGDDVVAVLNALKLERPVLVGHSAGGEELSSIGSRYPERVAGLVYLDAAYQYAFYDSSQGFFPIDLQELKNDLAQLDPTNFFEKRELVRKLAQEELPVFQRDLKATLDSYSIPLALPSADPTAADSANLASYRAWLRTQGTEFPEAEIRNRHDINPDGSVGKRRDGPPAFQAILEDAEIHGNQNASPCDLRRSSPQQRRVS